MTFEEFKASLAISTQEDEVRSIYATYFKVRFNTANRHDLYTPQVLFEFKQDKNFNNLKALATILAQSLYYIRRLKYIDVAKPIPSFICLADKNESALTETAKWKTYYSNDGYDWERTPSKPDPKLIDHLVKDPETENLHIYKVTKKQEHEAFKKSLNNALHQMIIDFVDRKVINEGNFEAVFDHWKGVIGPYIINGYKPSFYFLANIQRDKIIIDRDDSRIVFTFEDKNSKTQKVLMKDYDYFWSVYDYVSEAETINGIHSKLDRLTDESQRRFEGEFYTPLHFAQKAVLYWNEVLGKNWYKTGKYRIWDMAAGTGNLEYHLPAEAYKYLYMSTLHGSEADHLHKVFPSATCFQYDYLNDDVEYLFNKETLPFSPNWKLPSRLREELSNQDIIWLVYINPPFATAQVGGATGDSKKGVSKTKIEMVMDNVGAGHVKRELFAQFMFRIVNELPKNTYLGMFSKLKYLNAPDSIDYRDKFFNYKYEKGFLFKSTTFHGVKGKYPIGFLIWNLSEPRERDSVEIDIAKEDGQTIGTKHLRLIEKKDVLNNWFLRPQNSNEYILPPLSNGITIRDGNTDTRHRARPDFLASICSKGNDFQNNTYVTILSSPSVSAGAFTVNQDNFEKALTLHAVRKIPKQTWLNDRNQFLTPRQTPTNEFLNDCVLWSLFASSNETTSLRNVSYLGKNFNITNHLFPFTIEKVKQWEIKDSDMRQQLTHDVDRFAANWISQNELSDEAIEVIESATIVYKIFFSKINKMATSKWKIDSWDVGWYQLRRCLVEHNIGIDEIKATYSTNQRLASKILPQIETFGFLDKDEVYDYI